MIKHKKTLEEKRLSDMRRQVYSLDNLPSVSLSSKITKTQTTAVTLSPVSYLKRDILKTFIITSSILIFQLALSFAVKNHAIRVPGVSY